MEQTTVIVIDAIKHFFEKECVKNVQLGNDERLVSIDSQRIFHGRGGCFPELEWCCVDFFAPVVLITCFREPPDKFIDEVAGFISSQSKDICVIQQNRHLPKSPFEIICGDLPQQVFARRQSLQFILNFDQQNVGYFLDMEPGRQWLEQRAKDKKILNLFSYTCAFSIVGKEAGAREVVNIDMSKRGLSIGRENHRLNNDDLAGIQFFGLDILKSWSRIKKHGPYDIIIVDPPSYQKGSFVAFSDYSKIIRRLKDFSAPNAEILLCLNDPKTSPQFLIDLVASEAPYLQYQGRLPVHPDFPDKSEDSSLKLLSYRMCKSIDDIN